MLFCQAGDDDVAETMTEPVILIILMLYDGELFTVTVAKDGVMLLTWRSDKLTKGTLPVLLMTKLMTLLAGLG